MKITRETDYALRIMQTLSADKKAGGGGINAPTISENNGIPPKFTLKILRKLQTSGLVRSFKGAGGGYALAKEPKDITLLDIVESVDGPVTIHHCLDGGCTCSKADFDKNACFYHHLFDEINDSIAGKLRGITLDHVPEV